MKVKVLEKKDLGFAVIIRLERPENFEFKAGQHLYLILNNHKKPFSIANTVEEEGILLYIKIPEEPKDKEFFDLLKRLKENDEVEIEGPFGRYSADQLLNSKKIIYIAAGSGITPVRSSVMYLKDKLEQIVFYQEKYENRLIFKKELEKYAKVIPVLSRDDKTNYFKGYVQQYLPKYIDKEATYVIVGPPKFVQEVFKLLLEKGIKREQIKFAY